MKWEVLRRHDIDSKQRGELISALLEQVRVMPVVCRKVRSLHVVSNEVLKGKNLIPVWYVRL